MRKFMNVKTGKIEYVSELNHIKLTIMSHSFKWKEMFSNDQ